jgi:cytochrome P450
VTAEALVYDPNSIETARAPHALFRRMRDEAPLYYNEEQDFWALSRFEDVERGHVDRETFISGRGVTLGLIKSNMTFPPGIIIFEDPPTHTIHRSLLSRMFTPRRIGGLEGTIRDMCARLLDPLVGTGRFDWAEDLGNIMPSLVIGKLIGLDEQDSVEVRDHFDYTSRNDETRATKFDESDPQGVAGLREHRRCGRQRHHPSPHQPAVALVDGCRCVGACRSACRTS